MKRNRIEPLYRKVNSNTRNSHHHSGGDAKYNRNTKKGIDKSMHGGVQHGLDFTPLYKFLLSKVGKDFNDVYSEVIERLGSIPLKEKEDSIWWLVARNEDEITDHGIRRCDESSYYSQLKIDGDGKLQIAKPSVTNETLFPSCPCCTHTFNGKIYINKYTMK